jgi:hypothetical protein
MGGPFRVDNVDAAAYAVWLTTSIGVSLTSGPTPLITALN